MLEVRAARHGDAPALDALGAAPEAGVFVLEKNGAVIGALTLRAGEIFGCAVAPEWRGRGYGTFLLRRALRAAGPGPVCTQTPPGNAAMEPVRVSPTGAGIVRRRGRARPRAGSRRCCRPFEPPPKMGAGRARRRRRKRAGRGPRLSADACAARRFRTGRDGGQRP